MMTHVFFERKEKNMIGEGEAEYSNGSIPPPFTTNSIPARSIALSRPCPSTNHRNKFITGIEYFPVVNFV